MMKIKLIAALASIAAAILAATVTIHSQQPAAQQTKHEGHQPGLSCPMMQQENKAKEAGRNENKQPDATAAMNERGDEAMGFSHMKTTHHFRLLQDGGAIEVEVNDASDTASRNQIREHLSYIARAFAAGDFDKPFDVHAQVPSGVAYMKQIKTEIKYTFEATRKGGRVRISTANPEALAAVHDFLRFQIKEHRTGDPLEAR
ncbi:MAG TPA: hypothetical protein VGB17_19830 [Pyrinomonadaceae bacterium]|jgi:hypothetical protein